MSDYELVFAEPALDACPCCGGRRARLTRVVRQGGAPVALYYALYVEAPHPERHVELIVSVGSFAPGATGADREAVALTARHQPDGVRLAVTDATESAWRDVALLGRKLTAREAKAHPRLPEVLAIANHAVRHDAALFSFLSGGGGGCASCSSQCALRGAAE